MTPIAGFLTAILAGWTIRNGRRAAPLVITAWVVLVGVQTWYIASGQGASPSSTVSRFPQLIGYWLVQIVVLGLSIGVTAQLGKFRANRAGGDSQTRLILAFGLVTTVNLLVVALYLLDHGVFESASAGQHGASGQPPILAIAGMLLLVSSLVVLVGLDVWGRVAAGSHKTL